MLQGIHHVTTITGDAAGSVRFNAGVLGLRLVKKTVNHDEPGVYHLYFGDEHGRPRSLLTVFEIPGARRGEAGGGMFRSIGWRVPGTGSLDFWERRLAAHGVDHDRAGDRISLRDPEGLEHVLVAAGDLPDDAPALHPEVPWDHALREIIGVEALSLSPGRSRATLLGALGMRDVGGAIVSGEGDHVGRVVVDPTATGRGIPGGGTIHHVAFACPDDEHPGWRERLARYGLGATQVVDRIYFRSIYVREPGGLLVEMATMSPGMAVDEDPEVMGESLALPPWLERHRPAIEERLAPIANPRAV